jgi:hypothetical protein
VGFGVGVGVGVGGGPPPVAEIATETVFDGADILRPPVSTVLTRYK